MIAQRLAIAAIVATWSVPTIVVAQHAKAEPTAAHTKAPAKEPGGEPASSQAKKEVAAEPLPEKSAAKQSSEGAGKSAAKPTSEHAAAKSDGKDKDSASRQVGETKRQAEHQEKSSAAQDGPSGGTSSVPAHASAEKASSEREAEHATSGGKKVASTASARSKTAPKNELQAALERIDEQMATMRTSPAAARSGKPRAANETRPTRVSPPPAPSVTRISLSWRTTLVWEQELDGGTDAAQDVPHVALIWPIEPLRSTPLGLTSAR